MIAKKCPLESRFKMMAVLDGGCVYPYNVEPDEDLRNGWTYGMVDVKKERLACKNCTLRRFNYAVPKKDAKSYPQPKPPSWTNVPFNSWKSKPTSPRRTLYKFSGDTECTADR